MYFFFYRMGIVSFIFKISMKVRVSNATVTVPVKFNCHLKSVFPKLTQSTSLHFEIITFVFSLLFMESFFNYILLQNS